MEAVEIASIKDLGERGECDLCPKVMVKSERPSAETASTQARPTCLAVL